MFVGILALCTTALFFVWWQRGHRSPPPPASASLESKRVYWRERIKQDVSDSEAYLRLGQVEERAGYYTAAVRYLASARALGADESGICGPLGRALTHLGQNNEALPELEKAVRLHPNSVEAAANLAGLYVEEGRLKVAASVLSRFVQTNPNLSVVDNHRVALGLMECGDARTARTMAERLLVSDPGDLLARGIAVRGAIGVRDFAVARKHLEVMLKAEPNDAGTLYLYGNTLYALGERDSALLQWQKTVALNSGAADAFERIGNEYASRRDFTRAAVAYEALARLAPIGRTASLAAASLYRSGEKDRAAYWGAVAAGFANDYSRAIQQGRKATASTNPSTRRMGLHAIAEAYRGMRKRDLYLATMQKMTAAGSVDDLVLMAQAWEEADRHAERCVWLERAARKATPKRRVGILYSLGVAYKARSMHDKAEKALEEAAALDPEDLIVANELATIYFARHTEGNRLEKAIRLRETVLARSPDSADAWRKLGTAYAVAGQTVRAVRCLEHAVDLEPGDGPVYLELSQAYAKLGDVATSKRLRAIYTKYVTYDQRRQTLRTRAWRPDASLADLKTYANLMYEAGALADAAEWYEKVLARAPGDQEVRQKLITAYTRLRRADRLLELRAVSAS